VRLRRKTVRRTITRTGAQGSLWCSAMAGPSVRIAEKFRWCSWPPTATAALAMTVAAIGVLSWLTFYFSDNPMGASSFYAQLAGFLGKIIAPRHTASLTYFKDNPPGVSWGFVFVVAAIVGGAMWIAVICFFVGSVAVALPLFKL
jgi:hypothetical protein